MLLFYLLGNLIKLLTFKISFKSSTVFSGKYWTYYASYTRNVQIKAIHREYNTAFSISHPIEPKHPV